MLPEIKSYTFEEHIEQAESYNMLSEEATRNETAMRYLARAQYHATMALVKKAS